MIRCSTTTLQLIAAVLVLATNGQALAYMEENLVMRYDFNKGRGTTISDQTGLGYAAHLRGNAAFIDNDPWANTIGGAKFGNAITLDGSGDYLRIESSFHNDRLNLSTLAIAAWIHPTSVGTDKQYLVSKLNHAARTGYALAIDESTGFLHAEIYIQGSEFISEVVSSTAIPNNRWTHVVASFDGSSLRLYLNGIPNSSANISGKIAAATEQFTIGALSGTTPSKWFNGAIDELRLYSSISAADVSELAAADNGEPDLILYESFDTINRIFADAATTGAKFKQLDNSDLVEGQYDNALHFQDGYQPGERLSWPVPGNLNATKGHITMWFRPDWAGSSGVGRSILETDNHGLASGRIGDGIRIYRWANKDGDKEFRLLARGNYVKSTFQEPAGINSWAAGQWHFLELIWDTSAATPYLAYVIDGELARLNDEATSPASGAPKTLYLGSSNGNNRMGGTIDELKVYSRPQYDVFNPAEKIAAITLSNRGDGHKQPYETVYNSSDAPFPGADLKAKDPIAFFQTAPFERVYAGDLPNAAQVSDTFNYNVAKNDTESLFFNIYSQIDTDDVSIVISGLTDAAGTTIIDAADMQLMVVKKWWQRAKMRRDPNPFIPTFVPELLMYDDRYNFKHDDYDVGAEASHSWNDLPDFPVPATASVDTALRAYTSKQFMLNIGIPDSTPAGTYTATATVSGTGISGPRVLRLNVNVQNIELPKADKDFIIFHRAQYLGTPNERNVRDFVPSKDYYLRELQDIFEHGFNGVMAYGTDHEYISDIAGIGFDGKVIFTRAAADPATTAAIKNAFGEAWFYSYDEPADDEELERQMRHNSYIHEIGAKAANAIYMRWADCLSNPHRLRPDPDNGNVPSDFCPYAGSQTFSANAGLDMVSLSLNDNSVINQDYLYGLLNNTVTRDTNEQTYYWQSRTEDPRFNRYLAGFHLYLSDLDGVWPYAYIHKNASDPFDDLDADERFGDVQRDMSTVYPTQQGPMSTIEWEAMREGIDDYRYLQLWQLLHDKMVSRNPNEAARSRTRIELNEEGIGLQLFRHQVAGALNLSNADFAATRELIAEEILTLQTGLADPDGDYLATATELLLTTKPLDDDTDNDWLRDGHEIYWFGTDPLNPDSDADGFADFAELMLGTSPTNAADHP